MLKSTMLALSLASLPAVADVTLSLELPRHEGSQYRPYVAVWVENPQQQAVATIAVWRKEADWLKDMRRWWRKSGRYENDLPDGVSGATRKPGVHQLHWDGRDHQGNALPSGRYTLHIEAVREHGSRSLVSQSIELDQTASYHLKPVAELGPITIHTGVKS